MQRGVTGVAISLTSLSSHYKHGPQRGSPAPHAHPLSLCLSVAGVVTFASSKWGIMRINRPCALHLLPSSADRHSLPCSLPLISLSVREICRRLSFTQQQLASIKLTRPSLLCHIYKLTRVPNTLSLSPARWLLRVGARKIILPLCCLLGSPPPAGQRGQRRRRGMGNQHPCDIKQTP